MFSLTLFKYEYFYPLYAVGCDSETQLQPSENLNKG